MADKFIIHGATFNGDGTTNAAAASNGAAGAWNTITYFEGATPAYGAINDGDVVYIRSKDASGAGITRTLSAGHVTLGKAGLTATSVGVRWVIDNGVTWSGISGTLKYTRTGAYYVLGTNYNSIEALTDGALEVECNYSGANNLPTLALTGLAGVYMRGLRVNLATVAAYSASGPYGVVCGGGAIGGNTFENLTVDVGVRIYQDLIICNDYARNVFINPTINVPNVLQTNNGIFKLGSYGSSLTVFGGRLQGAGVTDAGGYLLNSGVKHLELYGFEYPKSFNLRPLTFAGTTLDTGILAMGLDDGLGSIIYRGWGQADSRNVNNYPYLNATYPNSTSTPWSWRVSPRFVKNTTPMELPFHALFTDNAGVRTVTLQMLVADTFVEVTKGTVWMDVHYVEDSTGKNRTVSNISLGSTASLDSSSAAWLPSTSWGAISCVAKKISITTPSAIKKDTMVMVVLRGLAKAPGSSEVMFVDPSVVLAA